MSVTIPHEREILAVVEMVHEAYGDPNYLGIIVTDTQNHVEWIAGKLRDSVQWDNERDIKIFRDGVEVKGGGKVRVVSAGNPGALFGSRPSRVVILGRLGELFYHLQMFPKVSAVG